MDKKLLYRDQALYRCEDIGEAFEKENFDGFRMIFRRNDSDLRLQLPLFEEKNKDLKMNGEYMIIVEIVRMTDPCVHCGQFSYQESS